MAKTSPKAIKRELRISAILTKRLTGTSLRQIGAEEDPPISLQAVAQLIGRAVSGMVAEPLEQVRQMELLRLDELLGAIWPQAKGGDIAAVDRVLSIMQRRARLIGLDVRPAAYGSGDSDAVDAPALRIEIVNNPEFERIKWLESERVRLLEAAATDTPVTVN